MNVFFQDPWWLIAIKVLALFVILLVWTIFNVWYERRLVNKMQHRLRPIILLPWSPPCVSAVIGIATAPQTYSRALCKLVFPPAFGP